MSLHVSRHSGHGAVLVELRKGGQSCFVGNCEGRRALDSPDFKQDAPYSSQSWATWVEGWFEDSDMTQDLRQFRSP